MTYRAFADDTAQELDPREGVEAVVITQGARAPKVLHFSTWAAAGTALASADLDGSPIVSVQLRDRSVTIRRVPAGGIADQPRLPR